MLIDIFDTFVGFERTLLKHLFYLSSRLIIIRFAASRWCFGLLSQSSLEPLISLDLVGTKLYCFRARVHYYHCLYIVFSTNPVRRSEELRGRPFWYLVGRESQEVCCNRDKVVE